jgi:hypothetical protein
MKRGAGLLLLLALYGMPAQADLPALSASAGHDIHEVLKGPDFNVPSSGPELHFKHPPKADAPTPQRHLPWALSLGRFAGVLLWVLLGVAVVALLWHWRRWAGLFASVTTPAEPELPPAQIRRQALAEDSPLPADVLAAAEACWAAGDRRAALSLLYRGALAVLQQRAHLQLPDSATEQDSLRQVRASQPKELVEGFSLIVRAWLAEAYGGEHPADFAPLAQAWRQHFSGVRP